MDKSYTITELVDKANAALVEDGLPGAWNVRLVRYYTSEKKILAPPERVGREARYTDAHLDKLVSLRRAQNFGLTAEAFDTASRYSSAKTLQSNLANSFFETPALRSSETMFASAQSFSGAVGSAGFLNSSLDSKDNPGTGGLAYLRGLVPASKLDQVVTSSAQIINSPPVKTTQTQAVQWVEIELMDGVRLQMRADKLTTFNAEMERDVVDNIRALRKNGTVTK